MFACCLHYFETGTNGSVCCLILRAGRILLHSGAQNLKVIILLFLFIGGCLHVEAAEMEPPDSAAFMFAKQVFVGEILGVEYIPSTNRLLLYATPPTKNSEARIEAADAVNLALALANYGSFNFSLETHGNHLEIEYLHSDAGPQLKRIFQGSSVEATFLFTDRILKQLVHGHDIPQGLRFGATQLLLCRREVCGSGTEMASQFTRAYVTFYRLRVGIDAETMPMLVYFRDPALGIDTASRNPEYPVPDCVRQFAQNLERNMEQLYKHPKLGPEFRRLKALLLLAQAIGWANLSYVPIDVSRFSPIPATDAKVKGSIPIKRYPVVCRNPKDPKGVIGFTVSGGISVFPGYPALPALGRALSGSKRAVAQPSFYVSSESSSDHLIIDISDTVGLRRRRQ
jgi:hypothetical protein